MDFFNGFFGILLCFLDHWKLLLFLTVLCTLYHYYTARFDFFEKKGIPYKKPVFLLGSLIPTVTGNLSFHELQRETYNYFKGQPYGGHFEGRKPVLNIFDPELIKAITIRDYDHFTDRGRVSGKEPRYLKRALVNLKGSDWKGVRSTVTPAFSSPRVRNMFPLIELCSQQLVTFMNQYDKKDVEIKEAMGHFTLEVIGACAFGIKCDALSDENTHFLNVAQKFDYIPPNRRKFMSLILMFMPQLLKYLPVSAFFNIEATDELVRILRAAKAERRKSASKQSDFLQSLLDFAEKEKMEGGNTEIHLDDDTIDAQLLLFLMAGYDNTSSLLAFAIHVLATKPELQDKLRTHVVEMTEGKEMSYELIAQMTYLEAFLMETLRIYPLSARIGRVCTKPYILPGTTIQLNPGDVVVIPFYGIHMDPDIYPDPDEFRPERFMGEEKNNRAPETFLTFGSGARNCIGTRFAIVSTKLAMATLITNFKFSKCDKTEDPIELVKKTLLLKAKNGLWVRVEAL